jgi:pilus assembly protein Flp/PilA
MPLASARIPAFKGAFKSNSHEHPEITSIPFNRSTGSPSRMQLNGDFNHWMHARTVQPMGHESPFRGIGMKSIIFSLCFNLRDLANREEGQDLVEYALIVALIAFGATTGMTALAGGVNSAFYQISTTLGSYVS